MREFRSIDSIHWTRFCRWMDLVPRRGRWQPPTPFRRRRLGRRRGVRSPETLQGLFFGVNGKFKGQNGRARSQRSRPVLVIDRPSTRQHKVFQMLRRCVVAPRKPVLAIKGRHVGDLASCRHRHLGIIPDCLGHRRWGGR